MLAFKYIKFYVSVRPIADDPLLTGQLLLSGQFPFSQGWPINKGWTECYFQRGLRDILNKEATKPRPLDVLLTN